MARMTKAAREFRRIRVAHLVSHPIQYFAPLYRELATRREIDFTVYFYSGFSLGEYFDSGFGRKVTWDVPLTQGYNYYLGPRDDQKPFADGFDWRPSWSIICGLISQ